MTPRIYSRGSFTSGTAVDLPDGPSRHLQVLRLQPGDAIGVFDGLGHEWHAVVEQMGRRVVTVRIGDALQGASNELACRVTLAFGVPANDRMDALVEKSTELGVHAIQPLMCERSVLRLKGDRNDAKQRHWAGIAAAASEQCGRAVVPEVAAQVQLAEWLQGLAAASPLGPRHARWMLSFDADASLPTLEVVQPDVTTLTVLSGPEGGLAPAEALLARAHGFQAVTLGPRVLRADTAPLAVLAWWGLASETKTGPPTGASE